MCVFIKHNDSPFQVTHDDYKHVQVDANKDTVCEASEYSKKDFLFSRTEQTRHLHNCKCKFL